VKDKSWADAMDEEELQNYLSLSMEEKIAKIMAEKPEESLGGLKPRDFPRLELPGDLLTGIPLSQEEAKQHVRRREKWAAKKLAVADAKAKAAAEEKEQQELSAGLGQRVPRGNVEINPGGARGSAPPQVVSVADAMAQAKAKEKARQVEASIYQTAGGALNTSYQVFAMAEAVDSEAEKRKQSSRMAYYALKSLGLNADEYKKKLEEAHSYKDLLSAPQRNVLVMIVPLIMTGMTKSRRELRLLSAGFGEHVDKLEKIQPIAETHRIWKELQELLLEKNPKLFGPKAPFFWVFNQVEILGEELRERVEESEAVRASLLANVPVADGQHHGDKPSAALE